MIVPTIGEERQRKKVKKTTESLNELGEKLKKKDLDTLFIISPHLPLRRASFSVFSNENFAGNFKKFGDFETQFSYPGDPDLAEKINEKIEEKEVPSKERELEKLDHGSLVPLFFLLQKNKEKSLGLVPFAFCDVDLETHFRAGEAIGEVIAESNQKVGICASGDLSHRLKEGAPAGYHAKGKEFDKKLVELIKEKKTKKILNLDKDLIQKAGECGLRSVIVLLGALRAKENWEPNVLSYEGPFGVGYLTADFRLKTQS